MRKTYCALMLESPTFKRFLIIKKRKGMTATKLLEEMITTTNAVKKASSSWNK